MKQILCANVRVPDWPRVRFVIKSKSDRKFEDVTGRVARLVIEDLEEKDGEACKLTRLDADGKHVFSTRHPSVQEAKWQAVFEYGLPEERWLPYSNETVTLAPCAG